jgi:hypothetical protein
MICGGTSCLKWGAAELLLYWKTCSKVKVKLPLRLTKHHILKTYGRVEVQLHAFLTSALDGGEWSRSRPGRFIPGERASDINWIGVWVSPRSSLERWRAEKFSVPDRKRTPVFQPSHYTNWPIIPTKHSGEHLWNVWFFYQYGEAIKNYKLLQLTNLFIKFFAKFPLVLIPKISSFYRYTLEFPHRQNYNC